MTMQSESIRATIRLTDRLGQHVASLALAARRRWRARGRALALGRLDDFTLKDIGVCRCEIAFLANLTSRELEARRHGLL